jgi:hypothetical protein
VISSRVKHIQKDQASISLSSQKEFGIMFLAQTGHALFNLLHILSSQQSYIEVALAALLLQMNSFSPLYPMLAYHLCPCCEGLRSFMFHAQALELAFKNETVGLVTRDEFVNKRNTIQKRIEEQTLKQKREAEEAAARVIFPPRDAV